jgi:DNA polymerase III epsilon subunit-like protein
MKLLWIDTETTGLKPYVHDIVSLAALVDIDGTIVNQVEYRMCPHNIDEVQAKALIVNGFTKEQILEFDDPKLCLQDLTMELDKGFTQEDPGKYILAGYNVGFDKDFLFYAFRNAGIKGFNYRYFHYKCFDVYTIAFMFMHAGLIPSMRDLKLATVCEAFSIPLRSHDAMNDIVATRALYYKLLACVKPQPKFKVEV